MSRNSKEVTAFRRRRKADLIKLLGGKCQICGFDLFPDAQDFHHKDPSMKDFGQSNSRTRSLTRDISEVKKCVLLCANCHRGVHAGLYECPQNSSYSFDVEDELIRNIGKPRVARKKKVKLCADCGSIVYRNANLCRSCLLKTRAIKKPSRDALKKQVRTNTFSSLAKEYSVDRKTISNWCKSYNLPFKKSEILSISDVDWTNI